MEEHEDNWDVLEQYGAARHRDRATPDLAWERHGPSGVLEDVLEARIPAYHWNGWYDIFVTDAVLWFENYRGPQKLGIGAWPHAGMPDPDLMAERIHLYAIEQHRWFDYWLKGIDNGVLDEAPIHYAVMNDPGDWRWTAADAWAAGDHEPAPLPRAGDERERGLGQRWRALLRRPLGRGGVRRIQGRPHDDDRDVFPLGQRGGGGARNAVPGPARHRREVADLHDSAAGVRSHGHGPPRGHAVGDVVAAGCRFLRATSRKSTRKGRRGT